MKTIGNQYKWTVGLSLNSEDYTRISPKEDLNNSYAIRNIGGQTADLYVMSCHMMVGDKACSSHSTQLCKKLKNIWELQEFFINKRDHPVLRHDLKEPYERIWGGQPPSIVHPNNIWVHYACRGSPDHSAHPTQRLEQPTFASIKSFYTNVEFQDEPFPTVQDWEMIWKPLHSSRIPFERRKDVAFFRGSATGYDVTAENPRIRAALISLENPSFVNARLTSWNTRHKFNKQGHITFLRPFQFPQIASKRNYVPMQNQDFYKYTLYIDGQVGASRLLRQLSTQSVVLFVQSKAPQPWARMYLKDKVHCVYVRHDLDNLLETIQWCRDHDEQCREIVNNANILAQKMLTKEFAIKFICSSTPHKLIETEEVQR